MEFVRRRIAAKFFDGCDNGQTVVYLCPGRTARPLDRPLAEKPVQPSMSVIVEFGKFHEQAALPRERLKLMTAWTAAERVSG